MVKDIWHKLHCGIYAWRGGQLPQHSTITQLWPTTLSRRLVQRVACLWQLPNYIPYPQDYVQGSCVCENLEGDEEDTDILFDIYLLVVGVTIRSIVLYGGLCSGT